MDSWKVFRQKELEHYWRQLPDNMQTDDNAKELARIVNQATGVTSDSRGEPLFRLQALIWLGGAILTATLPVSKFHLVWIYPLGMIAPYQVYKLRMKKSIKEWNLRVRAATVRGNP